MICVACGAETPSAPCVRCGREPRVDGRWRLLERLDAGHFATIWRAYGEKGGYTAAAKEIPIPSRDPKAVELAAREARVLRELRHPGVPRWIDDVVVGKGRNATLWLFEELIEGDTLAQEIGGRVVPVAEALDVLYELLGILEHLHALAPPVIHRDVKPPNVIRRASDGALVLVDFGAVRDTVLDDLAASTVVGTFGYMAPEQLHGAATPVCDLYAVGAIAVEMLTGKPPRAFLDWSGRMRWASHATAPADVVDFVEALVERDPSQRVPSALEARRRIEKLQRSLPSTPAPEPIRASEPATRTVSRRLRRMRGVADGLEPPLRPERTTGGAMVGDVASSLAPDPEVVGALASALVPRSSALQHTIVVVTYVAVFCLSAGMSAAACAAIVYLLLM